MEFVYVVPRAALFPECYPQGLVRFGQGLERASFEALVARHGYYVEREHAERDPALKQIIPYILIERGGELFLLRRLKRGGESRLHDKLSLGVGGHIEPHDLPSGARRASPIERAARRELAEELELAGACELDSIGLINDDSNPVGAVHLGWVQVARVAGHVAVRETELLEGRFQTIPALRALRAQGANFESWSSMLLDSIELVLATSDSSVSHSMVQ
jgi:predicted NUDIX family phosphoesterase